MHNKCPAFSYFLEKAKFSNSRLLTTKKIISTILAIALALLLATTIAFIVSCRQWNPEDYAKNYKFIWKTLLIDGLALDVSSSADKIRIFNQVFSIMGILIVSALAFIVAFKAGLFNMGVSGQMFAGAIAATFVAHKLGLPTGLSQVVMLLVAIGAATIVAVAIGAMKVFLNVNEVVSSIMLNWFIYFIGIMLLGWKDSSQNPIIKPDDSFICTKSLDIGDTFSINGQPFIAILILTFICIVCVSLFLKFTVAGKKQVATGLSKTASIANGYNVKLNVISAMAISGILAGVLGCMVYCGYSTQMPITAVAKSIPQEGFNGIAVGLIAMNNPIACVPIAYFFALIQESATALNSEKGIDPNIPLVIFGIVVYGAAAISLFMNIKPYWLAIKVFKGKKYSVVKNNHNLSKIILIDIGNEQLMLLDKNYVSYLSLTKTKGTLKVSCLNKIQGYFATIRNKICFWWLSKVRKLSEIQLRQNQHLNKLQNLRINHTGRIAAIKTNMIQKEAYEKTSKWFSDNFGIQHIASKQELKAIKHAFYLAFFTAIKEIDNFYDKAYQGLKNDRYCSLDKLEIRYDENLIPQIYFDCVRKELKKIKMPTIFAKTTYWQKIKRFYVSRVDQSSDGLLVGAK